jgi:hypothetical protein
MGAASAAGATDFVSRRVEVAPFTGASTKGFAASFAPNASDGGAFPARWSKMGRIAVACLARTLRRGYGVTAFQGDR